VGGADIAPIRIDQQHRKSSFLNDPADCLGKGMRTDNEESLRIVADQPEFPGQWVGR